MSDVGDEHRFFDEIDDTYGVGDRTWHAETADYLGERPAGHPRPSRHERHDDPLTWPPANDYGDDEQHQFGEKEPPRNRHHRADPDDAAGYGRHSFRD